MIEVALLSAVDPLGDVEVQVGGSVPVEGRRRAGTFLVSARVRLGEGARKLAVPFEDAGTSHLEDHLRFAAGMHPVPPRLAVPFVLEALGSLPGHEHARDLLARAGELREDPAPSLDEPAPSSSDERRVFLDSPPFPGSGLTEAEIEALGLVLPVAVRAMARSSSIARARLAAAQVARKEAQRLEGTPIEARVRRITDAVEQVLAWSGRGARAELVGSWRGLPLAVHPIALDLVERAALHGPALVPDAPSMRLRVRPVLAALFPDASTRLDLLRIELGASIAATLEMSFTHRGFREHLPPEHVLLEAALAGATAAIDVGGSLHPARAEAACVAVLEAHAPLASARQAAELGARSVVKLSEAAAREPVREWAVGDLDEVVEPTCFTHGPPR